MGAPGTLMALFNVDRSLYEAGTPDHGTSPAKPSATKQHIRGLPGIGNTIQLPSLLG